MQTNIPVITLDGPGGSGKGTISRLLAQQLGWHLLESGSLYRLLALAAQHHHIAFDDIDKLSQLAEKLDAQFLISDLSQPTRFILEGQDVTPSLTTEACGNAASQVSIYPAVREALLARQRDFRQAPGLIAEGRDMGSVVFPDAALKIFLCASIEERAQRRYNQLKAQGIHVSLDALQAEVAARDARDSNRDVSPLKATDDAKVIDTSNMGIPAVLQQILSLAQTIAK